jgi:hypothetical protein
MASNEIRIHDCSARAVGEEWLNTAGTLRWANLRISGEAYSRTRNDLDHQHKNEFPVDDFMS